MNVPSLKERIRKIQVISQLGIDQGHAVLENVCGSFFEMDIAEKDGDTYITLHSTIPLTKRRQMLYLPLEISEITLDGLVVSERSSTQCPGQTST